MNPNPMNAPVKPAVLPVVALVLGVIGFCFPPFFLIAIVLAIVSLVKAAEPAYAARKTLAIITLVLGFVYVPVVGILAAIAIPNFIKFQARSKQSECKANLKAAFQAQKAYFAEKNTYGTTAEEIGFSLEPRNRYNYRIGPDSLIPATQTTTPSQELEAGYPPGLIDLVGLHGDCADKCDVTMVCAGNVDNDPFVDVWSISTGQRTANGEVVPAGVPFNEADDLSN
ncbi:MAG: pilin [Archangium sp.]|nr:pilin [Archangium sp.]